MILMENNIYIPALIENWQVVYDFLGKCMEGKDIEKNHIVSILFASEEIYVNISKYAYPESKGNVYVNFEHDLHKNLLRIKFIDEGTPFDPTKVPIPDVTESLEKRKIGGLGIFIVNKVMDSMEYTHKCGQNNLTIIKKIK